ncbi:GNAT family N-acetyltransferase [Aliivibrio kagoshimensis]|uniref:GNAT family N-acetyltransferase n=1 Tax=Aliivibrio kagoshimensis TaxID=2910230 RepID=UPI003D1418B2
MMNWICLPFNKLSTVQLYSLLQLRVNVFVVEQTCPYPELDDKDCDDGAYHLLGYQGDELVACARLFAPGVTYNNVSIGRVATKKSARGSGLGHDLMRTILGYCEEYWPQQTIDIGAQQYLTAFYQSHQFVIISDMYLEDDIPHVDMRLEKALKQAE